MSPVFRRVEADEGPGRLPRADLFAGSLSSRLILLLGRVMVLELNLAGREGRLAGETPEARFQSFAASLLDRETALGILRQYPVGRPRRPPVGPDRAAAD